jgi:VanZ family protein
MFTNTLQSFKILFSPKWSTLHRSALWCAIIAISYLATTSVEHKIQSSFNDKFNHLIAFVVLSFLAHIAYPKMQKFKWVSALFFYGLLIEVVQYFLPYREFSLFDLATDSLGIIGYLIIFCSFFDRLYENQALRNTEA